MLYINTYDSSQLLISENELLHCPYLHFSSRRFVVGRGAVLLGGSSIKVLLSQFYSFSQLCHITSGAHVKGFINERFHETAVGKGIFVPFLLAYDAPLC